MTNIRQELYGRIVQPITTVAGRKTYYSMAERRMNNLARRLHLCLVPVSDGDRWALYAPGEHPIPVTDFIYSSIIVERWGNPIFFVQDPDTRKWGALGISINLRHTPSEEKTFNVKEIMPMIADDIYEDEMMDGCGTYRFWMIRSGDKVGLLTTDWHSDIIYDSYADDSETLSFTLLKGDTRRTISFSGKAILPQNNPTEESTQQ
jgi:hypothetical protein